MKKLELHENKSAQMQARLFENSIEKTSFSSPMFIRRFMTSEYAIMFSDGSYFVSAISEEEIFDYLNQKYKTPDKASRYSKDEMYWIGYICSYLNVI